MNTSKEGGMWSHNLTSNEERIILHQWKEKNKNERYKGDNFNIVTPEDF